MEKQVIKKMEALESKLCFHFLMKVNVIVVVVLIHALNVGVFPA